MTSGPFLIICLVFFGGIGLVALPDLLADGPLFERGLAAFFLIMAVWAAGLLLQPQIF